MDIYVVYEEFQQDTPAHHAAFVDERDAQAFAAHLRVERDSEGVAVLGYEAPPGEDWPGGVPNEIGWDVDIVVEKLELRRTAPTIAPESLAAPAPPLSLDWSECNPCRLKAVARIEGLLLHLEALRVVDRHGVQAVATDGLTTVDAVSNSEVYEGLQHVQEGKYATAHLPGRSGSWICFAVPFTE